MFPTFISFYVVLTIMLTAVKNLLYFQGWGPSSVVGHSGFSPQHQNKIKSAIFLDEFSPVKTAKLFILIRLLVDSILEHM